MITEGSNRYNLCSNILAVNMLKHSRPPLTIVYNSSSNEIATSESLHGIIMFKTASTRLKISPSN